MCWSRSGFILVVLAVCEAGCQTLNCRKNFKCLPISKCFVENDSAGDIYYPCLNGICCPVKDANRVIPRSAEFPENCGLIDSDDKITGGETASVGQFPWMALLGYTQRGIDFTQFLCGGSLISSRFILSAAHCIDLPGFKLTVVRLGELDVTKETDCDEELDIKVCSDPYVDVPVERILPHEKYDKDTLKNDIAIIKMRTKIAFTEFIRPICLPFDIVIQPDMFYEKRFTVSGWGKISSEKVGGSDTLQFAQVTVWTKSKCNKSVPPEVRPINDQQICANGRKSQDACKGDSGGPLFNTTTTAKGEIRNYQIGVVSFSSAMICGNAELPTIYTRVDTYLKWIIKNAK